MRDDEIRAMVESLLGQMLAGQEKAFGISGDEGRGGPEGCGGGGRQEHHAEPKGVVSVQERPAKHQNLCFFTYLNILHVLNARVIYQFFFHEFVLFRYLIRCIISPYILFQKKVWNILFCITFIPCVHSVVPVESW